MKKVLKLLALLFIIASFSSVSAKELKKIAVFPVNTEMQGSSYDIYPNILTLISSDLVNSLNKNYLKAYDLSSSEDLIKANKLAKTYNNFIKEYKTSYTFDYDSIALIAKKIGASKILLVSGGVDSQNDFLKSSRLSLFSIPGLQTLSPSHRVTIMLSLIVTQSGLIEWEKTYNGKIRVSSNGVPSPNLDENLVSVEDIKKFSRNLGNKASKQITKVITNQNLSVESSIIPAKIEEKKEEAVSKTDSKDGNMTKDGPSIPAKDTKDDYALKRKDKYKNWIKEQISH